MNMCTIWVDGDSCPVRIRSIIERAAQRRKVRTVFVADRRLPVAPGGNSEMVILDGKRETTDDYIAQRVSPADLVITRDIGLSARIVGLGAVVIDDTGTVYSIENIGERHSIHRFMSSLRARGLDTRGGTRQKKDPVRSFADAFDRELTARLHEPMSKDRADTDRES